MNDNTSINNNTLLFTIQKEHLSHFQSEFHKNLNKIKKLDRNITSKEMITLLKINNELNDIIAKILDLTNSFYSHSSDKRKLSKKDKEYLKEVNENNEIYNTLLPYAFYMKYKKD